MDRDEAIARIRKALRQRSGKAWSVTGGRGTAWGWITIDAPPARRTWKYEPPPGKTPGETMPGEYVEVERPGEPWGHTSPAERAELAALLGLERVHHQGVSIAASSDYRIEYVDRAEGRAPSKTGTPYWD